MGKRKLKRAVTLSAGVRIVPHDRRSTDLLINAHVAAVDVDDPYEHGAKVTVLRSLRDDPLSALQSAGQIEQHQFHAGRHWQNAFELAGGAGCRAIDPTREAVDGGQIAQTTISESQVAAFQDLARATKALGLEGESIVLDVLGRGLTIAAAAARRRLVSEPEKKYLGRRFRECLDTLAEVYGFAMRSPLSTISRNIA